MAEYIDKAYALEILQQSGDAYGTFSVERSIYLTAKQKIKNIPAADVAPVRHGKWIYGEDIDIQCSVCGADAMTCGDYRQSKSNYCPNCGAKMDLED